MSMLTKWKELIILAPVIHCGPANGNDYTLCGAAMDGESGGDFMIEMTRGKIDCKECIRIIQFCKSISSRNIKQ